MHTENQLPRLSGSALKVPGWVGSYPILSQAPTPVEVELGCDNNSLRQYGQHGIREKLVMKRKLKIFLFNHKGKGFEEIVNHRIDEIDNFLTDKCA